MQHDHVLIKLKFDLLNPSSGLGMGEGGGGRGSAGKTFATMLLTFVIPFNTICNLTMFCNK